MWRAQCIMQVYLSTQQLVYCRNIAMLLDNIHAPSPWMFWLAFAGQYTASIHNDDDGHAANNGILPWWGEAQKLLQIKASMMQNKSNSGHWLLYPIRFAMVIQRWAQALKPSQPINQSINQSINQWSNQANQSINQSNQIKSNQINLKFPSEYYTYLLCADAF